jgi:hypothetical protein
LMPTLMPALMTAALRRAGIVVAARLALRARLMALVRLMGLLAGLVVRIMLRLRRLVGLLRLMGLVHLMRLVIWGAAVARPGDEGRQVVLDIVARRVGRPRRPVVLLKAPAADLARTVRRHAAAAVAAAPRAAMQARLLFRETLARLRIAPVGLAHPALAGAAVIRIAARSTRRISFVGHRLSLSLCASRRITMGYGKE